MSIPKFGTAFDAAYGKAVLLVLIAVALLIAAIAGLGRRCGKILVPDADANAQITGHDTSCALFGIHGSAVIILDERARITFATEAAAALFKCTRDAVVGQPLVAFVRPKRGTGQFGICTAAGLPADGGRLMLGVQASGGRMAGCATRLIGTQVDITDLRHARNTLELSEPRFRSVLEDAPVGMAVLDEQGHVTSVNAAQAVLTGYDADMLQGNMRLVDFLVRQDFVRMVRDVHVLLAPGAKKTYQRQLRLRTRDSEIRWGLLNLSWTYDKNLSENVYIAQIVDITDQMRLDQIKSEFVAMPGHELRTPLKPLKGALGLREATQDATLVETSLRLMEIARLNADRPSAIVNDILDLESIASGEVIVKCDDTPLEKLFRGTLGGLQPMGIAQGATLDFIAAQTAVSVDVDVDVDVGRFRQVMVNLVSSACKFLDPPSGVTVRCAWQGGDAVIYVENTAPPVPESFRFQMFEAFTQADGSDTRRKGGAGLGLNIAREIVTRQGGKIGREQLANRCTVFWFTCPISAADAQREADATVSHAALRNDMPRVLYIADDREFDSHLVAGFSGLAEITRINTLRQARNALANSFLDVVLLDRSLTSGGALEMCGAIAGQQPQVPLICFSPSAQPSNAFSVETLLVKSEINIPHVLQRVLFAARSVSDVSRKKAG